MSCFTINIKEDENKLLKELQMDQFSDNKIDKKVLFENVKLKVQNYNQLIFIRKWKNIF